MRGGVFFLSFILFLLALHPISPAEVDLSPEYATRYTVEATLLATHQLPLALDHSDKLWLLSSKGLEEASPSEAEKAVDRAFGHGKVRFNARRRSFEDSM